MRRRPEEDARAPRVLQPEEMEMRRKVEAQVAAAVTQAWRQFREGNIAAADRALGKKPDSEIFLAPPVRAAVMRWQQASLGYAVILFLENHPLQHHERPAATGSFDNHPQLTTEQKKPLRFPGAALL